MEARHFPFQNNQRFGGVGQIVLVPHVLKLLCGLRRSGCAQISQFSF